MHDKFSAPISRRQTLATLGAGAAGLALTTPASALEASAAPTGAQALLTSVADNLLALSPEGATSLGIDTGARAAMRGQLSDRSAAGQKAVADTLRADLARVRAVDTPRSPMRPAPASRWSKAPIASRSTACPALWRCRGRRLAQHALCRDPECRRLSRRAAVPRQRSSGRRTPPMPKPICPPRQLSGPARRRARRASRLRGRKG